jgi:plastocyanin domain-containing protein
MASRRCHIATTLVAAVCAASLISDNARSADPAPIVVTLGVEGFAPAEIKVAAGQPFVLKFVNQSPAAAEIEAKDFKVEKVVPAGGDIIVNVKPQAAGRYLFTNEYKEDTVKGFVIVE